MDIKTTPTNGLTQLTRGTLQDALDAMDKAKAFMQEAIDAGDPDDAITSLDMAWVQSKLATQQLQYAVHDQTEAHAPKWETNAGPNR